MDYAGHAGPEVNNTVHTQEFVHMGSLIHNICRIACKFEKCFIYLRGTDFGMGW